MSWQWWVDVFGTVRTARFLYNVTASSRLGFLRRHRPSTYYVAVADTYFYANVARSFSRFFLPFLSILRYLLSCSSRSVPLSHTHTHYLSLSLFHCLSISVFLTMESGHSSYSSSLMFDRFPCCCIFFHRVVVIVFNWHCLPFSYTLSLSVPLDHTIAGRGHRTDRRKAVLVAGALDISTTKAAVMDAE